MKAKEDHAERGRGRAPREEECAFGRLTAARNATSQPLFKSPQSRKFHRFCDFRRKSLVFCRLTPIQSGECSRSTDGWNSLFTRQYVPRWMQMFKGEKWTARNADR